MNVHRSRARLLAFNALTVASAAFRGGVAVGTLSACYTAHAANQLDLAAQVDPYVAAEMARLGIPGLAIAIVQGDDIVLLRGYGEAERGRGVTPQTPFALASVSKSLTALAVLQLAEARQLDLDRPVTAYLPWFRLAEPGAADRITVRQLLNQTSGLPTLTGRKLLLRRDVAPGALERGVRQLERERLTVEPGVLFQYCNANFATAAAVVAEVAKQPFDVYVQERLFAPMAMRCSFTSEAAAEEAGLAKGHRLWFGYPVVAQGLPYSHQMLGASGMFASAQDLARYLEVLLNDGTLDGRPVVNRTVIEALLAPSAQIAPDLHYALGWLVRDAPGEPRLIFHGGDEAHYHADLLLIPDQKLGVAVLMNVNSVATNQLHHVARNVLRIAQGRPLEQGRDDPTVKTLHYLFPLLLLCQGIAALVAWRRMRRWRTFPAQRPSGRRLARRAVISLVGSAMFAAGIFLVLPWWYEIPFSALFVYAPDFAWPAAASGVFAVIWSVLRISLTRPRLRVID